MEESILRTIRKMLGPETIYEHYDTDIIIHINTALSILAQAGVGPSEGFSITSDEETWEDFLGDDTTAKRLEMVKTYVYLSVRINFDPPQSSAVLTSMEKSREMLEWRLSVAVED